MAVNGCIVVVMSRRPLNMIFLPVYLKIGGVCGLVAVGAIGMFTVFSGEIPAFMRSHQSVVQ